jgi:hypothetical protein
MKRKNILSIKLCIITIILIFLMVIQTNVNAQIDDTTPPELVNLQFSPTSIDVSEADQNVTVTIAATDDLVGISYLEVQFISPSAQQIRYVNFPPETLVSGDMNNGVFESNVTFPQYSETGIWHIYVVYLEDNIVNYQMLHLSDVLDMGFPTELYVGPLNQAPVANAGPDQASEVVFDCMTLVTLDGSGSSDDDGDLLGFNWTWKGGSATGDNPTIQLPLGTHIITLFLDDGKGGTDSDTVNVTVIDTTPPQFSVSVSPDTLRPPNHKMVEVNVDVSVSDNCDPDPDIVLVSVDCDEPDNALGVGDGNTINDIQNVDIGTEDYALSLRAERQGEGDGRIYTITYEAIDDFGNSTTATATVIVPYYTLRLK